MFIDTHAHVNFSGFREDAENVIQRALEAGVSVVNVGTQINTSKEAIKWAEKFQEPNYKSQINSKSQNQNSKPGVYAVVGIHPVHTYEQDLQEEETKFKTRGEVFNYEEYKKLAQNPLVVGIGECGLDYYRLPSLPEGRPQAVSEGRPRGIDEIKQLQKDAFIEQIKLALELDKALVIHTRASKGTDDACLDVLDILISNFKDILSPTTPQPSAGPLLKKDGNAPQVTSDNRGASPPAKEEYPRAESRGGGGLRFVLHSYTSSPETAQKFIDLGAYISFNGILTFDKTGNQEAVLKITPNDRIILETDCPYLTPVPHRGKKNEPLFVKHVAERVAELKEMDISEVENVTTENAKRFYKI
jgi:TatD DNase family protein